MSTYANRISLQPACEFFTTNILSSKVWWEVCSRWLEQRCSIHPWAQADKYSTTATCCHCFV